MDAFIETTYLQGHCCEIINNLYYVPILKNASTTLATALQINGYDNFLHNISINKMMVVLRDPVNRFLSNINMCAGHYGFKYDRHMETQASFLTDMSFQKADFFYMNDNLLDDIANFYNIPINTNVCINKSGQQFISINDDSFIKRIYSDDYDLLNMVKFVNKGPVW